MIMNKQMIATISIPFRSYDNVLYLNFVVLFALKIVVNVRDIRDSNM